MYSNGNDVADFDLINREAITVTELTKDIKKLLENKFPYLWVKGEVTNFKKHSSGHLYFSLKDAESQISCVMWKNRNRNLLFRIQDGMKVLVFASMNIYMQQGRYQLNVQQIRPLGKGDLHIEFEKLKKRLDEEGLFNKEHKRDIPLFPQRIGIVTSPTGAAIQDIKSVLQRRFPSLELILWPSAVQGEGAAEKIAEGIEAFNQYAKVDLLIISRGGGSLEDLWPFNEEVVARAIYKSEIPVISAVGHEIDYSISDLVADKRAPTPSAAAEIAVPDREELLKNLFTYKDKLIQLIFSLFTVYHENIESLKASYGLRRPVDKIREYSHRIDDITTHFIMVVKNHYNAKQLKINNLLGRLKALDPQSVLKRGYSITTLLPHGTIISQSKKLKKDNIINTRFAQGSVESIVKNVKST